MSIFCSVLGAAAFLQRLLSGEDIPRSLTVVDPLLTTQWDQYEPYSDSCPYGIELGQPAHALTGCVATAMAQVMKYWNYPERGTGSHTYYSSDIIGISNYGYGEPSANFGATVYDWGNMPDSLTPSSPVEQKAAVATLMYHCGVACDMHYGSEHYGSGSKILNIPYLRLGNALNGMIKYFGYSSSATGMERSKYDNSTWAALVRGELDASRPIITPDDYKVTWQVRAKTSSSDSYTLTIDTITFSDTVSSVAWEPRELLFSVAADDTVRLDFCHFSNYSSGGVLIDNVIIERMSGVGVYNVSTDPTLTVYPNPTNGHITIGGMPEGSRIELYDATGRLVKVSTDRHINISNCPAGVYILHCISSDGVTVRRVIKR
ncbi:MAG: C10 family peptidase [Bacteroidales bacterium]|nr:C10 family peptidase [Bacteroidales bacterium]